MTQPRRKPRKLADAEARRRIREDLETTFTVEAAAGTGKTTALVQRIVATLSSGLAAVDSFVAVTFTEKAAGELKLRLRAELESERQKAAANSTQRTRLEQALARLEEARVGTIHGFCADLLRERSIEAGVDPEFAVLQDGEDRRLFDETFNLWLQQTLSDPPEGIRRSLRRSDGPSRRPNRASVTGKDHGPVFRLRAAAWELTEWRDFPTLWQRDAWAREQQIDGLIQQLHPLATMLRGCRRPEHDDLYKDLLPVVELNDLITAQERVGERDYDGLEAALVLMKRTIARVRKGRRRPFGEGVTNLDIFEAYEKLFLALEHFTRAADSDLAAALQRELQEAVVRYEERKRRLGRVDFVDLLLRTRDLIAGNDDVRRDFQQRFTHIFVDEFQDTDPLQAEILLLLGADDPDQTDWRRARPVPGKLFLVGDPKQSIYRFRRADVGTYLDVKERLLQGSAEELKLRTSFRAVPNLQRVVNHAFTPIMKGDAASHQSDYVPLAPAREDVEQPSLVALPVPEPYARVKVAASAIDRSLPDATGAFIAWLVNESGWTVTRRESPGERVPVEPRDVCILFRRFTNWGREVARPYVDALEARGVRHLLVGGRGFHAREEVETLRTALSAIEWPDDELSVFATLHGSLFAIGDEELLEYRHRFKRLHPFRLPESSDLPERLSPVAQALALLRDLHRKRNRRPIAETIDRLLEATRAHAGFVMRPAGEQALANVLHIAEQARTYEAAGGISFRGFVERLLEESNRSGTEEAPILEEGSDGVRLMTVHKAKGLEFPVVILADMTARLAMEEPSRHIDPTHNLCAIRMGGWLNWSPQELLKNRQVEVDREAAEGQRIAYVAATRARDLLVVPTVGDSVDGGNYGDGEIGARWNPRTWLSALNHAVYPPPDRWRLAEVPRGCPTFTGRTVVRRSESAAFNTDGVTPGLHRFEGEDREARAAGGHAVTWWDPNVLELNLRSKFGIRQEELLSKDVADDVVAEGTQRFARWQRAHAETVLAAAHPGLSVQTVTQAAQGSVDDPIFAGTRQVQRVELPVDPTRPGGTRFGALVHAVLATVPLDAVADVVAASAALQGRILGAPEEEVRATATAVQAALAHDVLQQARAAAATGHLRRETPVTLELANGTLLEGVVDLAFLHEGVWHVVDFKTDQELSEWDDVYRRQVAAYVCAIAAATGVEARGMLLRV